MDKQFFGTFWNECTKYSKKILTQIMNYSELFERILAEPTLYIGNCNILYISFFMSGYIHSNWEKGNEDISDIYFDFQNWIAAYYGVSRTLGWANIITLFSSSEDHAFEITVKLWNEYKSELETKVKEQTIAKPPESQSGGLED